jgi:hypothetical protein
LRVTPCSTAPEIKQAYEDAIEDEIAPADILQRAQQSLLTPKLRIDAEVGGLLDVRPELAKRIIGKLEGNASREELEDELVSLHALPKSNVLAHLGSQSPLGVLELLQLLEAQATVAVGSVHDAVIEAREQAGVGKVDRQVVAEAVTRLEDRQIRGVVNTLAGTSAFAATFSVFVKHVLGDEDTSVIQKLDPYLRAYNNAAASELSLQREKVVTACDAVRNNPKNERAIEQIGAALRRWNEFGEPLKLFESHMHREDAQARELYLHVRNLCIWLANEKEQFDTARQITQACAVVFRELPRAIGQMKEDGELLAQLHNQQTALEPLRKAYEEAQENHRLLEQELLKNGFGPASGGIAKTLYDAFAQAVRTTLNTDVADLPWRLVRNVAISLNNESRTPKAAAALINGLIQFFGANRPSTEVTALLEDDRQACNKMVIQADLVIADRRRSKNIKGGFLLAAAAVILLIIITNQDNRAAYSSSSNQSEDRPPIGTEITFTRANIRYCQFQGVRLEALRPLISSGSGSAFNRLIDDWNSRCSRYRYRASDKSAVDSEVITHRSALQSEGWAMAYRLH